jgi:hypothetical protein
MRGKIYVVLGLGIAALVLAAVALAGTVTATATVTGAGAMSLTSAATATMSDSLDGTDQAVVWTLPLTVVDARGSGAGWNLTVTSTTFNDGASHTLSAGASQVTAVSSSCNAGGSCSSPTDTITYPMTAPAGATAPTAVKLFNAAAASGMGRFTVTPSITTTIPGNAYAGSYTSTWTVAAVSGP